MHVKRKDLNFLFTTIFLVITVIIFVRALFVADSGIFYVDFFVFFIMIGKWIMIAVLRKHTAASLSTVKLQLLTLEAFKSINRNSNIMKIPLDASKLGEIGLSNDG